MLAQLDRQSHARAVLGPVLETGASASHAYLFYGPGGAGKRAVARAMAAELLAAGSRDPDSARRRALSGAHPDLTWVTPSGAHEILVSDIDGPIVAAASKTPFEAERRVFVIERVDELGEEAANRMLKTLEEPPWFVHMILLTDRLTEVLPTISSRCQLVRFDAPAIDEVEEAARELGLAAEEAGACARLALGDADRALLLAGNRSLRASGERFACAVLNGEASRQKPWIKLLAEVRGQGDVVQSELERLAAEEVGLSPKKERRRLETEWSERIRRSRRRVETRALDLALQVAALWFSDLAAVAWGAGELVRNKDRVDSLKPDSGVQPGRLVAAIEAVEETRRRFQLNVSEDLACEALAYRLERVLAR